jgi:hypothetical protein
MTRERATQVMLKVHREGIGVCGVYPRTSPRPKCSRSRVCAQAPAPVAVCDGGNVDDRPGTRSQPAHGLRGSAQKRHEFITVEHLLLALLDNPTAAEVCAPAARTWTTAQAAVQHIAEQTPASPDRKGKWTPSRRWDFSA